MPGKVIVITGAGGGLGRALSRRFAADGDKVVMLGRTLSKLEDVAAGIGENATPIACDITVPASVEAAFARIGDTFGKIDALINNAGVFQPSPLEKASSDLVIEAVMANLAGPALCARSAIPLMQRGSKIVNVTSESVVLDLPHLVMYQSAKAGLERFSTALDRELDEQGIRVCTVRAGTMIGEGMAGHMEPETVMALFEASRKRGFDMATRGWSSYESTLDIFRLVVDCPPDIYIPIVGFHGQPS